ncbi:aminopeptidase N-like [Pectinophora gossypiella]|uniref:aminopeptidase N-like n=1 Tax=Pectinophora gossypiella TaxID=13191 RepID=UPI00214F1FD9|nr:aminopeptidase N-like [Pectinophora gossypiella]
MYLLLCLALLGPAMGIPLSEVATRNEDLSAEYVLPGESFPTFYDVQLFLDPGHVESFTGSVSIRVLPVISTSQIVLHAMAMEINNIAVYAEGSTTDILNNYTLANNDTHLLRINLNTAIQPMVPHIVNINYTGQFAENMFGVYVSTYQDDDGNTVNLITSQLQPTFARRAFPCYDEPARKAIFRTTIYAPPAFSVVRSNMPIRTDELKTNVTGYVKYEFQDTLEMSTYLLAYLVSNFEDIDNSDDPIYNIPFKVFSRPGTKDFAAFALDYGQRNMLALEEYTELPYAFPKIDKVAVPDFAAGAMENWGLVIYREVALLIQEGVTTTAIRQNIARIICHENTHMWFGNEVTPQSWTYTWLNEGFANFFENYGTDLVLPNFRMMDQYVLLLQNVMQNDAVLTVNPMTHPVYTPSEILGTFNAVAYQKSGSVIRMTQHFLTPEVFRRGLVIYLRDNSRQAAAPANLYAGLQQALDESNHTIPWTLDTILTRWTTQGGFPVLNVRRTSPTAESIFVSQERYFTDSSISSTDRWHVPINWVLSTNVTFNDTSPQAWIPPSFPAVAIDIPGLSEAEWIIVNKQQTGYYRVNYDTDNWQALANVLNSSHLSIHVLNRAQIVDDSFNLARNGRLSYIYPFEISRYLVKEKDYVPWASANNALNYLSLVLSASPIYDLFQYYMLNITAPLFEELGFEGTNEEHVTAYHRNIILNINCQNGNQKCLEEAESKLESFRQDPSQTLNPDIQTTVFCSGLRGGSVENFNFLWQRYLNSTDSSEQSILLNALGCTPNEDLLEFYLNQVISNDSDVRDQDLHTIVVSVINASPQNMDIALDFVIEHFDIIQSRVQGISGTANILNAFARRLTSEEHDEKIDTFVERHGAIFTAAETAVVGAIKENIASSITWSREHLAIVDSWLRLNYGNGANAVTASILLILSIFITFFNR